MAARLHGSVSARRRRNDSWIGLAATSPALVLMTVLFVVPLILMIWMSLTRWSFLGQPSFIGVDNYVRAFTEDTTFVRSIVFTLVYTLIITPVLFVGGLALALFIRRRGRASGVFRTIFFTPYVVGFAAASFLWLWLVNDSVGPISAVTNAFGIDLDQTSWLVEKWPGLIVIIVMVTWKVVGFQMILLLGGLQGVPDELLEAAEIDGANWFRRLFSIILPLMRPTVIMVLVFSISGSLLAFEQFFLITSGRPNNETITQVYWIYNMSFTQFQLGYGAALSVFVLMLLLLVTAVQLKFLKGRDDD